MWQISAILYVLQKTSTQSTVSIHCLGDHWQAKGKKVTREVLKAFLSESFPQTIIANLALFKINYTIKTTEKEDRMEVTVIFADKYSSFS